MSDNKELEMLQDGTKVSPETDDMGSIHVDDEVLSIVAGLAASEVPGVYGMSGGIRGGINECWENRTFPKASRCLQKAERSVLRSMSSSLMVIIFPMWPSNFRKSQGRSGKYGRL